MNKVKPFYIRITDDMTPQMVQDAFDKCVDAGVEADECILDTKRKHRYQDGYYTNFNYFGVDEYNITVLYDNNENYGDHAKEITLDQLDEWLGSTNEAEWTNTDDLPPVGSKVMTSFTESDCDSWCDFHGPSEIIAYHGDYVWVAHHGKFNRVHALSDIEFKKPETPEQKAERERLEAAYDLYCNECNHHKIKHNPVGDINLDFYLRIVDKTGYRKQ